MLLLVEKAYKDEYGTLILLLLVFCVIVEYDTRITVFRIAIIMLFIVIADNSTMSFTQIFAQTNLSSFINSTSFHP